MLCSVVYTCMLVYIYHFRAYTHIWRLRRIFYNSFLRKEGLGKMATSSESSPPANKLESIQKTLHDVLHTPSAVTPVFELIEKNAKLKREYIFLSKSAPIIARVVRISLSKCVARITEEGMLVVCHYSCVAGAWQAGTTVPSHS